MTYFERIRFLGFRRFNELLKQIKDAQAVIAKAKKKIIIHLNLKIGEISKLNCSKMFRGETSNTNLDY